MHNQVLGPVIFQGLGPGRGNGITAQRRMDQVLHRHVLPFFSGPRELVPDFEMPSLSKGSLTHSSVCVLTLSEKDRAALNIR
nr:hypothetical protein BaRGS_028277 [Batillaria attramentaria]